MKRWTAIIPACLCMLFLVSCMTQEPSEPERNTVLITVPDGVVKATVCVPNGQDLYLCEYVAEDKVASLVELLKQIGERPEFLADSGPIAGHSYDIIFVCSDGSEESYFLCEPYIRQGDGPWCELHYEKEGWLMPWLEENEPDKIKKQN